MIRLSKVLLFYSYVINVRKFVFPTSGIDVNQFLFIINKILKDQITDR